jgi:hypothetical protein
MKITISKSIHEILEDFLDEQQARLSPKTYSGYEEAISFSGYISITSGISI